MELIGGFWFDDAQLQRLDQALASLPAVRRASPRKKSRDEREPVKKRRVYTNKYKSAAKRVRERAGNKCEQCSSTKFMMVHHIDKDIDNNEMTNLVLLCFDCHKKHHPHLRVPGWMRK